MKTSTGCLLFDVLLGGGIEQGKHYCLIGRNHNFSIQVLNKYFKSLKSGIYIYDKSGTLKHEQGEYNSIDSIDDFLKSLPDVLYSNKEGVLIVTLSGFDKSDMDKLSQLYVKHNTNTTLITLVGYIKTDGGVDVFNVTPTFQATVKNLLKIDRSVWKGRDSKTEFNIKSYSGDTFRFNRRYDNTWFNADSFQVGLVEDSSHTILNKGDFNEVYTIMSLCRLYGLHEGFGVKQSFSFDPKKVFENRLESAEYLFSNTELLDNVKLQLYNYISEEVR